MNKLLINPFSLLVAFACAAVIGVLWSMVVSPRAHNDPKTIPAFIQTSWPTKQVRYNGSRQGTVSLVVPMRKFVESTNEPVDYIEVDSFSEAGNKRQLPTVQAFVPHSAGIRSNDIVIVHTLVMKSDSGGSYRDDVSYVVTK